MSTESEAAEDKLDAHLERDGFMALFPRNRLPVLAGLGVRSKTGIRGRKSKHSRTSTDFLTSRTSGCETRKMNASFPKDTATARSMFLKPAAPPVSPSSASAGTITKPTTRCFRINSKIRILPRGARTGSWSGPTGPEAPSA